MIRLCPMFRGSSIAPTAPLVLNERDCVSTAVRLNLVGLKKKKEFTEKKMRKLLTLAASVILFVRRVAGLPAFFAEPGAFPDYVCSPVLAGEFLLPRVSSTILPSPDKLRIGCRCFGYCFCVQSHCDIWHQRAL